MTDDELVEKMAKVMALQPWDELHPGSKARLLSDARAALAVAEPVIRERAAAEARAVRQQPCPFDSPDNGGLLPEDPCPVCGDLGTFDTEEPSHCITAKYRIRTGATP